MSRVAIIGSCITRDLWPIRGDSAEVFYVSRTSLPSLFSGPVDGLKPHRDTPPSLGRHQHRAVLADLQKSALAAIVEFRPTHLIFDFIDERFDLLSVDGTLVTRSWELEASGYLEQDVLRGARPVARLSPACERLWRAGAAEMAAFVRATPLREASLVLHSARWAERLQGAGGRLKALPTPEIRPGVAESINDHNRLLAAYEVEFERLMPRLTRVEAPEHQVADEVHRWGVSPFHYVAPYYEAIWRQLQALGVERPVSGPDAGPSARAA